MANPKQLLSLRLPPEVIAGWKATGPGWQTRMADVLKILGETLPSVTKTDIGRFDEFERTGQ
jgi:hypothetical protein